MYFKIPEDQGYIVKWKSEHSTRSYLCTKHNIARPLFRDAGDSDIINRTKKRIWLKDQNQSNHYHCYTYSHAIYSH